MPKKTFWERREVGAIDAIHPATRRRITIYPQRDAMISEDIDREITRLPGLFSWYLSLRDVAEAEYKEARHNEHNVEEDLYRMLRIPKEGGKKRTETEVKMAVKAHSLMRDADRKRMTAETMLRNLRSAVEAIDMKRWALQMKVKWSAAERGIKDSA